MDPMPPSIVVVMPCKPEVIIEEDLEDLNEDEFATTTKVSIPESDEASAETQNPKVVHLQIPPRASPKSKKAREHQEQCEKKKRTPEMAKVVSSLQFIKKWVEKNKEKDVFMKRFKKADGPSPTHKMERNAEELNKKWCIWGEKYFPLNPSQSILYWWLALVSSCVLYNCFLIIVRETYDQLNQTLFPFWVTLDYLSDAVYILDMGIQFITSHLHHGLLETDIRKLALHYIKSIYFWMDVISILPTDFLYFISGFGTVRVIVRINRVFRAHRMIQFFNQTENQTNYPNFFRVFILIIYITLIIHWNGCIYFLISENIGFGNDTWVYPALLDDEGNTTAYASLSRQYLFSFYWSTLTLTTIGELPGPRTDGEFAFVIVDFMVGVLIFATIVGMVGSIISNMNIRRIDFQRRLDNIKNYMRYRSVGKPLQRRVIKWFDYLWSNHHSLNEEDILSSLPDKLKTEIAMHVHFETLRQVKIFDDCEAGLLEELVLKLKPQVYSPGDYICRKGDIGKDMYIIKHGRLEVVEDDGHTVMAVLTDGGYFGEISILNLTGTGNRRTANVRSVGYSDLFCLSKKDLLEALAEFPDARAALEDRGRKTLLKDGTLTPRDIISLKRSRLLNNQSSSTMEALNQKVERMERNMKRMHSQFVALVKEYNTSQIKLKRRIKILEGELR